MKKHNLFKGQQDYGNINMIKPNPCMCTPKPRDRPAQPLNHTPSPTHTVHRSLDVEVSLSDTLFLKYTKS